MEVNNLIRNLITLENNVSKHLIDAKINIKPEMNQPEKDELLKNWTEFSQNVVDFILKLQVIGIKK